MFSLIAVLFAYRRQLAEAPRPAMAAPGRAIANDQGAVRSLARAA